MSLLGTSSRFLTLRPKVREEPPLLVISTGTFSVAFTLGLSLRRVEVDTIRKEIRFHRRTAWMFPMEYALAFDDIHYIDYGYSSMGTSWGWSFSGFGRQDEMETFTLSVVDTDGTPHRICAYRGEGSVGTGWSGVLLGGDELWDWSGTQESESRQLVDYLKKLLNKPIGKPIGESIPRRSCPHCGREVSEYAVKCLYCAKPLK